MAVLINLGILSYFFIYFKKINLAELTFLMLHWKYGSKSSYKVEKHLS